MTSRAILLDEFAAEYRFSGAWEISYSDQTHLGENEAVELGQITIDYDQSTAEKYPILPFTFYPINGEQITTRFSQLKKDSEPATRAKHYIIDELRDSLMRSGLLRPVLRLMQEQANCTDYRTILNELSKHRYLILVVDTGALRRGAVSFLCKALPTVAVWTVVPVFVMIEIQEAVARLKNIWKDVRDHPPTETNLNKCEVLGKRPQVSCISRELTYIKASQPLEVLTALPESLGKTDGESKIDRLIIESVKNLKRERSLNKGVYLLTADKDVASLATLENVNSLYIEAPRLPDKLDSIRYDSVNGSFVLASLHCLLWDLTQVFSTIFVRNKTLNRSYRLCYYCAARGGFFAHDVLEIQEQ